MRELRSKNDYMNNYINSSISRGRDIQWKDLMNFANLVKYCRKELPFDQDLDQRERKTLFWVRFCIEQVNLEI